MDTWQLFNVDYFTVYPILKYVGSSKEQEKKIELNRV